MESLSTQARQVLDQLKRPDVDFIHGLSPVLAIEQRTGGHSPRSTIATVTEIADYARLLWALAGGQCPATAQYLCGASSHALGASTQGQTERVER
jgi:excinuclease ABC subunit A